METPQKQKIDYNSITNQEIKSRFVRREVLTCFSYEMDAVLKASYDGSIGNATKIDLPTYEDIENGFEDICPQCSSSEIDKQENSELFECHDCGQVTKYCDNQPKEIYEWWIVTDFLCQKLREQGEAVLEWGNNCYWGRCTTGQGILLDHVISVICEKSEILDDQKYSWKEVSK